MREAVLSRIWPLLVLAAWLLPVDAVADEQPARGKLLVATELLVEEIFARTVILLLEYDENGAMGIVINRPTEVDPEEILAEVDEVADYRSAVYWGGPVQMNSLRVLMRTNAPPEGAEAIVGSVHQVPIDDELKQLLPDTANVRLYIGYAGWAPGQLDAELDRGSWHVLPASDADVFADEPGALWERLVPPRELRATASSADR